MDNSISRTLSRSRKALSNALLIYHALNEGASIQFFRSKTSNYALKVLRGEFVWMDSKMDSLDNFISTSQHLCWLLKPIIADCRKKNKKEMVVDKNKLQKYWPEGISLKTTESEETIKEKENCRNREAAFSNYLAYTLIMKGYKLHFNTSNMKETVKVMHFFVWNKITTPDEKVFELNSTLLTDLINKIKKKLSLRVRVTIDRSILFKNESKSVFTPVTDFNYYSIIENVKEMPNPFCN